MKIQSQCPICKKKNVQEKSHFDLESKRFITLDCGHTISEDRVKQIEIDEIRLADNRVLYPFQKAGVKFAEASNFKCLISDEMGLGKTIQAVGSIALHYEELKPILVIVKSSLTYQWMREIILGSGIPLVQILDTKTTPLPGFGIYISSFDSLPARNTKNGKTTAGLVEKIKPLGIKTLIIDECQMMKNHLANRTQAIREIVREGSVKHIIALSGTPIKNNAVEYFPILNLLRPEIFPNRDRYISRWVDQYWDGSSYKAGGIRYPEEFGELTKDFIIRRLRSEVLPDLPKIQRDFKFHQMGAIVTEAYNKKVKALSDMMDSEEYSSKNQFQAGTDLLAHLQILRHITGLAKIEPTLDYLEEYFEENPSGKITVFHHHIDVGEILFRKCQEKFEEKVIRMVSADDSETRQKKIEEFRGQKQILIAPTLACGEGINLQFCSHAVIMEREWNPANEEQAEGRFSRIGSIAESVLINYPTATETIDEFFAELVERKREIVGSTLDGRADKWNESTIIRELAELVVQKWRNK